MADTEGMRDGTRVVHAGLPDAVEDTPFLPGPVLAAPYHLSGDPAGALHGYGRFSNPTWVAFERAVGSLEGADALAFASGMAAVTAVLLSSLRPGDVLVCPSDGYPTVRAVATDHLRDHGIEVRVAPTPGPEIEAHLDGATLVWLESPANPSLDCCDIAAIAAAAHERGATVAVDNTLATPLGQLPLDLGADITVTSGTKALTGHADVLIGVVTTRSADVLERLRVWRDRTGGIPGPFETWLAHRSLGTLDVRLERQCANARAVADLLAGRDDVAAVRYPGLEGDPAHAVAARQMKRFGPVVSFDLVERERAERFLGALRFVLEATSFGGMHSSVERRARWGQGDAVSEGFMRLSCGIESTADLLAEIAHALDESR